MTEHQPLRTFIIYARNDEAYKNQLLRHLKPLTGSNGYLKVWHDGDILPGEDWEKKIKDNLIASDLVLVLVSVNCLNSDFIEGDELETAVARLNKGNTRIVPIIISPCIWRVHKIFNGLQGLPKDMKPVSEWSNHDSAWTNVAESLMSIVEETHAEQADKARKEHELAEKQKSEALAIQQAAIEAKREAQQKAEQIERERAAQEQHQLEIAAQRRREEEAANQRAQETAQKAEAERARREQQAEMRRLENEAWQAALTTNTPDAFDDFASRYPNSPNNYEAQKKAKALRRKSSFASQNGEGGGSSTRLIFIGLGTVLAIILAIFFWPDGEQNPGPSNPDSTLPKPRNAEPAAWSQAQTANTLQAYRDYLRDYPGGTNVDLAKQCIGEIKATVQDNLDDAERLVKNRKYGPAKLILRKILDELDPENARAKELMGQMPKEKG